MGGMGGGGMPPGMMGGGGPPPDMGEVDGGEGDTKWKWEMKDEEIIVRIALEKPAKKTDLKVVFGASKLKVEVFGETIIDGKLAGTVHGDESTWCLVEKAGRSIRIHAHTTFWKCPPFSRLLHRSPPVESTCVA